ncbi:hypothetical protein OAB57_00120 [Bacteriovoracaceae bacterium]|nr:hypothetical protein [Bacteriovoracaceae bacterium]
MYHKSNASTSIENYFKRKDEVKNEAFFKNLRNTTKSSKNCEFIYRPSLFRTVLAGIIEKLNEKRNEGIKASICSICLDPLSETAEGNPSGINSCDHYFHHDCISSWKKKMGSNPTCPNCRQPFKNLRQILKLK